MAVDNRLWGTKRLRGELLKLGIRVNKRTVRRSITQARRGLPPPHRGQTWSTFLANQASDIWACDFLHAYDVFFRTIFLFFIIELGSRGIVQVGITRSPTAAWLSQQLREATPFGEGPRILICDNDAKYGPEFIRVAAGLVSACYMRLWLRRRPMRSVNVCSAVCAASASITSLSSRSDPCGG